MVRLNSSSISCVQHRRGVMRQQAHCTCKVIAPSPNDMLMLVKTPLPLCRCAQKDAEPGQAGGTRCHKTQESKL